MKVYAICLEGYKKRRAFQELQALKYGLDLEIISAVDGSSLSEKQLQEAANYWSRPITAKDLGCFLSHQKVWELIQKRKETAVIIEDDIVFSPIISEVIREISANDFRYEFIYDLEYVPRNHLLANKPKWVSRNGQITATKIYQNNKYLPLGSMLYCPHHGQCILEPLFFLIRKHFSFNHFSPMIVGHFTKSIVHPFYKIGVIFNLLKNCFIVHFQWV